MPSGGESLLFSKKCRQLGRYRPGGRVKSLEHAKSSPGSTVIVYKLKLYTVAKSSSSGDRGERCCSGKLKQYGMKYHMVSEHCI